MAERRLQLKKDPSLYRLPPQNIEAEEALLSAVLLDNRALLEVMEILLPEDFYRSSHQKIFGAVSQLFARNEPVDLVTLSSFLRDQGQLEDIGGATYLASLVDSVPLAVNAEYYARIVHEKANLRRLINTAQDIVKRCYEDGSDVDEVVEFAETSIFKISENTVNPAFYPISKIIVDTFGILEERQDNRAMITGIPTGFSRIDSLTAGLQKSDLVILAGRPGMGKTALALNIARNAALKAGTPVAVFSLEMSKEQLSIRMLCSEASVDSSLLRSGFFSNEDWQRLTDAAGTLSEASIFIDDSPDISAVEIRAKARRLKMDKGLGLVIVDYIQLMKTRQTAERRDLEISEISRSLKILAKELDIPVVALSQLNRKLEERTNKRPQLSDLRESGALEQDADVVAFIYRDEVYNQEESNPNRGKAEVIVAKQRNGPTGMSLLTYLNQYTRFEDMADDSQRPYSEQ